MSERWELLIEDDDTVLLYDLNGVYEVVKFAAHGISIPLDRIVSAAISMEELENA